jgi:lysozyme
MTAESIATLIIKDWEKCRLRAYKPLPTDPWTIGWGATGSDITEDTVWTQEQADADLNNRVIVLGNKVRSLVAKPATDNQLASMIDLAYNIGIGAFAASTLLRLFNEGNVPGAGDQFLVWDMSAGEKVQGLENRRECEQRIYYT